MFTNRNVPSAAVTAWALKPGMPLRSRTGAAAIGWASGAMRRRPGAPESTVARVREGGGVLGGGGGGGGEEGGEGLRTGVCLVDPGGLGRLVDGDEQRSRDRGHRYAADGEPAGQAVALDLAAVVGVRGERLDEQT